MFENLVDGFATLTFENEILIEMIVVYMIKKISKNRVFVDVSGL